MLRKCALHAPRGFNILHRLLHIEIEPLHRCVQTTITCFTSEFNSSSTIKSSNSNSPAFKFLFPGFSYFSRFFLVSTFSPSPPLSCYCCQQARIFAALALPPLLNSAFAPSVILKHFNCAFFTAELAPRSDSCRAGSLSMIVVLHYLFFQQC